MQRKNLNGSTSKENYNTKEENNTHSDYQEKWINLTT